MAEKYVPLFELGIGAFGRAWVVKEKKTDRKLVSKIIQIKGLSERELDRCLTEVVVLSACNHDNIVRYIEAYVNEGALHIVMEYANGGDLQQKIQKQNGIYFPKELILQWFLQVVLALEYIHSRNILHRDLKPQNVFLTHSGIVKLGDFGIARVLSHNEDLASTRIGTPFYISPEICERKSYNSSSDMWAAGCLLYEMCLLRVPFNASSLTDLNQHIVQCQYGDIPRQFGTTIEYLILRLLVVAPGNRLTARDILSLPELSTMVAALRPKNLDVLRDQSSRSIHKVKDVERPKSNAALCEDRNKKLDLKKLKGDTKDDTGIKGNLRECQPTCFEMEGKTNDLNSKLLPKRDVSVSCPEETSQTVVNRHLNVGREQRVERSKSRDRNIVLTSNDDNCAAENMESEKGLDKANRIKGQPYGNIRNVERDMAIDQAKVPALVKQSGELGEKIATRAVSVYERRISRNKVVDVVSMNPERENETNSGITNNYMEIQERKLKSRTYSVKDSVIRRLSDASPKLSATIRRQRFSLSVSDPDAVHQKKDCADRAVNEMRDNDHGRIICEDISDDIGDGDDNVFASPCLNQPVLPRVNSQTYVIKHRDMSDSNNNARGMLPDDISVARGVVADGTNAINNGREVVPDDINSALIHALSVTKIDKKLSRKMLFTEIVHYIGESRGKRVIHQVRQLIMEDGQSYQTLREVLKDEEILLIPLITMFMCLG